MNGLQRLGRCVLSRAQLLAFAMVAAVASLPSLCMAQSSVSTHGVDLETFIGDLATEFGTYVGILVGVAFGFLIIALVVSKARKYVAKA